MSTEEVNHFLNQLNHPLKAEIQEIRSLILTGNPDLTERIKWNAPSFCFDEVDCITMKLYPPKNVQVIFHRGTQVKPQPGDRLISDEPAFLRWITNDRAIASFSSLQDIRAKQQMFLDMVKKWIKAVKQP